MEFYSTIYILVAFSFILYFYKLRNSRPNNPKHGPHAPPPEAGGARLFTGHLHLMSTGLPHFNLGELADKHGPIFTIRIGLRRALVVSSYELARELFTTYDTAISSRPLLLSTQHLSFNLSMFGFAPYGPYWRHMRKLVATELLSPRRLELQRSVRVSETGRLVSSLYRMWEEKRDGSGKVVVDMKQWFGELSLNVVLRVVAGRRFDGGDEAREVLREFFYLAGVFTPADELSLNVVLRVVAGRRFDGGDEAREVLREFFYLAGVFTPADALPYLRWLDLGGFEKRMKKNARDLDRIVGGWVASRLKKEYSGEDTPPRDFIDVMLSVLQGEDLQFDVHTITKATCMVLISGGGDTTTVMLIWALSLILNHPRVLKKAQEELDKHIGRERRVEESDIKNLDYLQAIVKETLRLYPAGPLGGIREFTKDCYVGGYHVPKGTWLFVNLWKMQRDPHVWTEEPSEFRPERFLNQHKNVDVKGQDFELLPFGGGRRICPGANFGLHMLHLALANLLQAFEVSTVGDEKIDMSESAGLTNMKATPLDVLVAPRLSPSLY